MLWRVDIIFFILFFFHCKFFIFFSIFLIFRFFWNFSIFLKFLKFWFFFQFFNFFRFFDFFWNFENFQFLPNFRFFCQIFRNFRNFQFLKNFGRFFQNFRFPTLQGQNLVKKCQKGPKQAFLAIFEILDFWVFTPIFGHFGGRFGKFDPKTLSDLKKNERRIKRFSLNVENVSQKWNRTFLSWWVGAWQTLDWATYLNLCHIGLP